MQADAYRAALAQTSPTGTYMYMPTALSLSVATLVTWHVGTCRRMEEAPDKKGGW
jgi:hypothetical protein